MKYDDFVKNEKFLIVKKLWFALLLAVFLFVLYAGSDGTFYMINMNFLSSLVFYLTVISVFYLIAEIVLIYYSKSESDEIMKLNIENEKYIIECFFIIIFFILYNV